MKNYDAATLAHRQGSGIAGLHWKRVARPVPEAGEVCIEVAATALNYRDVMWTLGLLPEEALEDGFAGISIGMECAGRIVDVGAGVEEFAVGDRVMAVATDAFATHVVTPLQGVARLPENVPLVAGATIPVAFLTAYYALVELAGLRRGETVLIHGGAGGVGLAAFQIARARGARVIATAGSERKRRLLAAIGADHVLDSRSLDFVAATMEATGGLGVDVVLNSLAGEAMERSISILKPFGRFLELGKRDYFADTKVGLKPFRRNISYFGIDADQLLQSRPEVTARIFAKLSELFDRGVLNSLAHRSFASGEVQDAFRLMQASGHIGKIIVTPPSQGKEFVSQPQVKHPDISEGIYLIIGGTGGFGLSAAGWLVQRGVRKLALVSRRGAADAAGLSPIDEWRGRGIEVDIHACDATDEAALGGLLATLRSKAPLVGVIHAAMVLDDAQMSNLDRDRNKPVIEAKATVAQLLDRLTSPDTLKEFILFSSISATIGNPGQASYVAGNGFLEGLARARRSRGLPALAAAFGAISDTGYLTRSGAPEGADTGRLGGLSMTSEEALKLLSRFMAIDPGSRSSSMTIAQAATKQLPNLQIGSAKGFTTRIAIERNGSCDRRPNARQERRAPRTGPGASFELPGRSRTGGVERP